MTTEVQTAPVTETVTPIGPREALRLGRLVRPRRAPKAYFDGRDGACAVGAMHAGWGLPHDPGERWGIGDSIDLLAHWGVFDGDVTTRFDAAEMAGEDGDAAVDAYLAGLGL